MTASRRRFAVATVYLGTFMASLAISIVSVALPAIQTDLGASLAGLQWIVGAYALCLSAFMLSAGPLADRYGRKRTWLGGVALFTLASVACAAAPSLPVLIAGCAFQGVAGALVIPGALSLLTHAFPDPSARAHVIGGWASFSAVSLILGPLLGGYLVDQVGWPSIFLVNLPLGIATVLLGLWSVEESANPEHAALDPIGQVLSIAFLAALTYGLIEAGQAGWTAAPTMLALLAAAGTLLLFIVVERRVARPVLPLDLFGGNDFSVYNFASFVLGFTGYTSLFLFSLFLQNAQGWTATQAGWRMAPVFVAMLIVSPLFGKLAARYGMRTVMTVGYLLLGSAMLSMARFTPATPYGAVAACFALLGVALGLAVPATGAAVMASAPRERSGAASATMNALRQSGMAVGIALLGSVMNTGAVTSLARAFAGTGADDPAALAVAAAQRRELPQALHATASQSAHLLRAAFAQGFSRAAIAAGAFGLVAALVLFMTARRA
ncbi:MAG: DHA2 family efflux MFS transporter permease subunit [Burkholderiaceae bacterium]